MERITRLIDGRYYVADIAIDHYGKGYFGEAIDRLAVFENMAEDLMASQTQISNELEKLRAEGKEKSVTFKELMIKKLTNVNMILLYKSYGIDLISTIAESGIKKT